MTRFLSPIFPAMLAAFVVLVGSAKAENLSVPLATPDGAPLVAEVTGSDADAVYVRVNGRVLQVAVSGDAETTVTEVRDAKGKLVLQAKRSPRRLLLTDGRGTSIASTSGVLRRGIAEDRFDADALVLLDSVNLARLRVRDRPFEPGFTIVEVGTDDSLCCDSGSVSNCFAPNEDGTCSAGKELTACPNDGPACEINGTWNCC